MYEYSSVRSSSYDLEGLIASLNAKDSEGWEVVSVVPAGGELAAILRRTSSTSSRSTDEATPAPVAASAPVQPTPAPEPEPASPEPSVYQAQEPAPVQEPPGWGAVVEPVASSPNPWAQSGSSNPDPSPAPSPSPTPTPVASTPPTQVQSAVPTTPAGWYPDPSGRFEMRYWDGNGWTEHVARGGQQFTDPPVA